ncbi:MAG: HesA/MoeB/ThiF family protein [Rikenellaceae bacterium]
MLNSSELERYTRQITLDELGESGQQRLKDSSVLIVGVGGLGSPIATLLTSSGFGRIGIVDSDVVSLSNLPRQTLYTTLDIGQPKVECAKRRLSQLNPQVEIEAYNMRLDINSAEDIASKYDIIVDACDNIETRYLMDSVSRKLSLPYIYGAISGFTGQVSIFNYMGAGSYSQLYPAEATDEMRAPSNSVIATTPAIIGAIEANEAIKIAIGYPNTLAGKLLTMDSRQYLFSIFSL